MSCLQTKNNLIFNLYPLFWFTKRENDNKAGAPIRIALPYIKPDTGKRKRKSIKQTAGQSTLVEEGLLERNHMVVRDEYQDWWYD